jgi:hypothetical protein
MVTALFEWFGTGEYSLKALAQRAFEEGFRFRKSQGKVPVATLHKILRNSIYMGEFDFGGTRYQGRHEPWFRAGCGAACKRFWMGATGKSTSRRPVTSSTQEWCTAATVDARWWAR